jgi:hypothetical protein
MEYKASKKTVLKAAVALKNLAEEAYALGYKLRFIGD